MVCCDLVQTRPSFRSSISQKMVNKIDRPNTTPTVRGIICTFAAPFIFFFAMMVNKIHRPNPTPTVRGICTFAACYEKLWRDFREDSRTC